VEYLPLARASIMISTEAIFRFDKKTKEVYLESLFSGGVISTRSSQKSPGPPGANPLKPFLTHGGGDQLHPHLRSTTVSRQIMNELAVKRLLEFAGGKHKEWVR